MAAISAGTLVGRMRSTRSVVLAGARRQVLRGPEFEIVARLRDVLVGIGMACQRGRQWLGLGVDIPDAIGQRGTRLRDFIAQAAQLLIFGGLQPPDLFLHRANAGDLADIGWHAPEEQVAGDVEGARRQVALVSVRLHVLGARQTLGQGGKREVFYLAVGGEQSFAGGLIVPAESPDSSGGVMNPEREKSW